MHPQRSIRLLSMWLVVVAVAVAVVVVVVVVVAVAVVAVKGVCVRVCVCAICWCRGSTLLLALPSRGASPPNSRFSAWMFPFEVDTIVRFQVCARVCGTVASRTFAHMHSDEPGSSRFAVRRRLLQPGVHRTPFFAVALC